MAMTMIRVPLGSDHTPDGLLQEIGRVKAALTQAMARESADPDMRWTIDDIDLRDATALVRGVGASAESLERIAGVVREQVGGGVRQPAVVSSLGTVRGRLESYDGDGWIVTTDDGARVSIARDTDIDDELGGRRVVVRGLILRDRHSGAPMAIGEVAAMVLAEPAQPGGLLAAVGAAPWLMSGEPLDAALRRLRDDG
jgi:hypothetical protein